MGENSPANKLPLTCIQQSLPRRMNSCSGCWTECCPSYLCRRLHLQVCWSFAALALRNHLDCCWTALNRKPRSWVVVGPRGDTALARSKRCPLPYPWPPFHQGPAEQLPVEHILPNQSSVRLRRAVKSPYPLLPARMCTPLEQGLVELRIQR